MKSHTLRTSKIAKAVGVHPNTVRLYEGWSFLPPVRRNASGYRLFTASHLDQMRLARMALHGPWPGPRSRRSALALVRQAAQGDLGGALEQAYRHLALVQAEAAAQLLERWAAGHGPALNACLLSLGGGPGLDHALRFLRHGAAGPSPWPSPRRGEGSAPFPTTLHTHTRVV